MSNAIRTRQIDVTAKDMAETFNFGAIQFGYWLNQDERQAMLNMAYDRFSDLANKIGKPKESIGLHGDLTLVLGARDQQHDTASAFYNLTDRSINILKDVDTVTLQLNYNHAINHQLVSDPLASQSLKSAGLSESL